MSICWILLVWACSWLCSLYPIWQLRCLIWGGRSLWSSYAGPGNVEGAFHQPRFSMASCEKKRCEGQQIAPTYQSGGWPFGVSRPHHRSTEPQLWWVRIACVLSHHFDISILALFCRPRLTQRASSRFLMQKAPWSPKCGN
jgi:hypothetical protein